MKRTFALPALALGAALSLGACAQDGATAPTSAPNAPSMQRNNANQTVFGTLIAALNNINAQIIALNNINVENVDITLVDIGDVTLNVQQNEILNNVLSNNNVDIVALQEVLSNNTFLNNFLNAADILITDVVAIDVLSGGDLVIFTR